MPPVVGGPSQPEETTPVTTVARPNATGVPGYAETMPCEPESARRARRLVAASLSTWRIDELADAGTLIVSELVSNAVRHTSCRLLRVATRRIADNRVWIEVTDTSRGLPEMGCGDSDREGGRGLLLVELMADRWGYDLHGTGRRRWKTTWAELVVKTEVTRL
ncbi:ATP-binding protein [Streptomyces sp. NPDC018693]|uniref:ATP-binding protein n=1 Tax=unclassified Streptomyces TaxID=2593676 RepID=UPI0037B0E30C